MRSTGLILCDNIVFELQKVGGISRYWSKTIERLDLVLPKLAFLEGPGVMGNAFRRQMQLHKPILLETGHVGLRRFSWPRRRCAVFHSSYYRVSPRAGANVVTIHDFMNEMFPSSFRDPILAWLKKRACRNADRIVVVSERTRQDLLKYYPFVDPGIVEVLYNGTDHEFFPEPSDLPFEAGTACFTPRKYFLYVGTRGYCKNFPYALKFLAEARGQGLSLPLVIVGGGPLSESERARAVGLGLAEDALVQLSEVSNAALRRLYSNCLALLIPSIYEGFGLPAAEAARCGALVLAGQGSALTEITGETDYSFDLARENEPARVLALGLDNAAANAERQRVMLRSANFSWDTSVQKLREIYDELR